MTMTTAMNVFELDFAWDDDRETSDAIEAFAASLPFPVWSRVVDASGPGGGWPVVQWVVREQDAEAFAIAYVAGDVEQAREEVMICRLPA